MEATLFKVKKIFCIFIAKFLCESKASLSWFTFVPYSLNANTTTSTGGKFPIKTRLNDIFLTVFPLPKDFFFPLR